MTGAKKKIQDKQESLPIFVLDKQRWLWKMTNPAMISLNLRCQLSTQHARRSEIEAPQGRANRKKGKSHIRKRESVQRSPDFFVSL
jgi:hypothetical protein